MEQRFLVFVALGDSLTTGFQSPTRRNPYGIPHPYTMVLQDLAWREVGALSIPDLNVVIENEGVNGDRTGGMLGRFDTSVKPHKPDYVLVWAGLNDISSGAPVDAAVGNIRLLLGKISGIGATPIACTLTPTAGSARFNDAIRGFNARLQELCSSEKLQCVDLYAVLSDGEGLLPREYSNDGAHLNTEGYTKVAETVFREAVKGIIGQSR